MKLKLLGNKRAVFCLLAAALVLGGALLLSTGCGSGSASASQSTFTYADPGDPNSLDPAKVDESVGANIVTYLYQGLVSYDPQTGEPKPALAETWDVNDDATVFTFHLAKGSNFSNGREVKAADFVYAWTRALEPDTMSSMAGSILGNIKGAGEVAQGTTTKLAGAEAVDDYTLTVTLESPMADFITLIGHPVASPVPQEEVEKPGVDFAQNPVGNGPFMLKEWRHNDAIVLDANPHYSGPKPALSEVTVKIIPNPSTAVSELKAGNIDAIRSVPAGQAASLREDSSVKYYEAQGAGVTFVAFNTAAEQLKDNIKLRQALNFAFDRQTLADKVLQGQADPADGFVPASVFGHQNGAMSYNFDLQKAKSLLAEAGYPDGQGLPPLTLAYPDAQNFPDIAQAVQSQLRAAGVPVELQGMEKNAFQDQMISGKLSLFLVSWQADSPTLDTFLEPMFNSGNIGATDVFNYQNDEVDSMIQVARSTVDNNTRTGLYNQAERQVLADAPVAPLLFAKDTIVYSPKVSQMVYSPLGFFVLDQIAMAQ